MMPPIKFQLKKYVGWKKLSYVPEEKERSISEFRFYLTHPNKFLLMKTYGLEDNAA